jgi:1-acyl-sn-glycerol-3-phosphate acyltransferase
LRSIPACSGGAAPSCAIPGTLVVEFLDPLLPGRPRIEFPTRIQNAIEEPTDPLVSAGQSEQVRLFSNLP